ncbi:MAG: transposase domain-containing protein [Salibacteraceae bacterium]
MYSFFGTCKMKGGEPFGWLRHTLTSIPEYPANCLTELLPIAGGTCPRAYHISTAPRVCH